MLLFVHGDSFRLIANFSFSIRACRCLRARFVLQAFFASGLALLVASSALAKDTGFYSPTNAGIGFFDWNTVDQAFESDGSYAVAILNGDVSDFLSFGLLIPSGASIEGIEVQVEGNNQGSANGLDVEISGDGGTLYTSSGYGLVWPLSSTDSYQVFGGPTDKWGKSWNVTDFGSTKFRVRLVKKGAAGTTPFLVDHVRVKVYYNSDTYILNAVADAWIKQSNPSDNYGTHVELLTKRKSGDHLKTIYRFDLSGISAMESITDATASLWITKSSPSIIYIHRITKPWTESTVDWTTIGSNYDPTPDGSFIPSVGDDYATADLTALVAEWHSGVPNYGFILIADGVDQELKTSSREWSDLYQRPRLDVKTFSFSLPLDSDLSISKTVDTPLTSPGSNVTYTIALTNGGPENATGVQVMDLLPSGVTFQGYWSTQGTYNEVSGLWDLGAVAFGVTDTLRIFVEVD